MLFLALFLYALIDEVGPHKDKNNGYKIQFPRLLGRALKPSPMDDVPHTCQFEQTGQYK